MNKIIAYGIVVMVVLGIITKLWDQVRTQRIEIGRLERNFEAVSDTGTYYKTKLGNEALKTKAFELSIKELKRANRSLYDELDAMDIRLKSALSATRTVTETKIVQSVKVDTINSIPTAIYKDRWNEIKAEMVNDSINLSYLGTDTITGVISIRQKRFLFFRYGIKSIEYDLTNKNTSTQIKTNIAVKLK
ncbi:hypothetical protein BV737P2_00005 [Phocaeicola phage BV737P2]|nr:hypothetical protein BV737P2_00005 [Phocaeicola phage BV737P2]